MLVPDVFLKLVRGFVALGALVAFVWLGWDALMDVMDADAKVVPSYNDWELYWLTALAALVGGVTAVAFGQAAPPLPDPPPTPEITFRDLASANLSSLAKSVTFGKFAVAAVGMLYVLLYLVMGIAACITWGANYDEVSQPVKNLALTFAGMVLPIAQGFFTTPSQD